MSFIDLATLALHRRNEMEARINIFTSKCDQAMGDIVKLKVQAQGFVHQLNCEPSELKERFLSCMKTLDEYIYLLTDFNLSISRLEETSSSVDYTPVLDTSMKPALIPTTAYNIIDILSEPTPSTSTACPNRCPIKHKVKKVPKEEQTLIEFSSASCSSESMPTKVDVEKKEQEVQCEFNDDMKSLCISEPETQNLPGQTLLQTDHVYPATIMNIDGPSLWVITEDTDAACRLMTEMTEYYKKHSVQLTLEEVTSLTYCAYYDDESDCYYRGLFIRLTEEQVTAAEVFLVDTGEVRTCGADSALQPLHARFSAHPPYARCCHLAGVELNYKDKDLMERQEQFLRQYIGTHCSIQVDDNTSESLGVYILLSETETLNDILVREGLATSSEKAVTSVEVLSHGPPELGVTDSDLDITHCPEYEDALEAVTGYSCRDEMDICKHYKGGPEKTCFKGARCKKRHVLKHPDGWTLDRVEVAGKCRALPLPAPGTWLRAHVTCVCHFDRLYVQFHKEKGALEEEKRPDFGVMLPPTTLDALIRDMNSPAQRVAYKPLKITPAPGELVAALYPPDNQWYRARVLTVTRADQNVEVMYIDYGNVVWVREDGVRELEARHAALPAQATRCLLAGVAARTHDSRDWAAAKLQLERMTQDCTLETHIIARDYDEVTVEMFDEDGYSIAEQLAALNMVTLKDYTVVDDTDVTRKLVVP